MPSLTFPRPLVRISQLHQETRPEELEILPAALRPFLRREVGVTKKGNAIARLETIGADFGIEDKDQAKALAKVFALLDGKTSLEQIAKKLKLGSDEVVGLIQPLYIHGMVGERTECAIPPMLFFEHTRATAELWTPPDPSPTGKALDDGTVTERLLVGDLLRGWFGTRAQATHLAQALIRAVTERSQHAWSRMLAEEYEHHFWLTEGLEKVLTREELCRAWPLPGQRALINEARWAAERDELAYAAMNALNETTEEPEPHASENVTFYQKAIESGALRKDVIEPQLRHMTFDAQRRHFELQRIAFEEHGPVSLKRRQSILGHVFNYVHASALMEQEQYAYYSNPANPRVYLAPQELESDDYSPSTQEEVDAIRKESVKLLRTSGGNFPYTPPRPNPALPGALKMSKTKRTAPRSQGKA